MRTNINKTQGTKMRTTLNSQQCANLIGVTRQRWHQLHCAGIAPMSVTDDRPQLWDREAVERWALARLAERLQAARKAEREAEEALGRVKASMAQNHRLEMGLVGK